MAFGEFEFYGKKIIIRIKNRVCENSDELISSKLFACILKQCIKDLQKRDSELLEIFKTGKVTDAQLLRSQEPRGV